MVSLFFTVLVVCLPDLEKLWLLEKKEIRDVLTGPKKERHSDRSPEDMGRTVRNVWHAGRAHLFVSELPTLFLTGKKESCS